MRTTLFLLSGILAEVKGQQFNTDNYLTMPHGTISTTLTAGQRNSGVIASFALIPRFEFFAQATLFYENTSLEIPSHFTTTVFAKYMFWVNEEKNGGGGVFLGIGRAPGYWAKTQFIELHRNILDGGALYVPFFRQCSFLGPDARPGL